MERDVFFVHGFEARQARHHRLAQAKEARAWAAARGVKVSVAPMETEEPGYARWHLEGPAGVVRFHLFDWSDIVAHRMAAPAHRVIPDGAGAFFRALGQGFFGKIRRMDRALWALLVIGFAPIWAPLTLGLAALAFWSPWLGALALVAALAAYWTLLKGPRLAVRYLLDISWGARRLALRDHPELEARKDQFMARIADAPGDCLVVGHSLGAVIAADCARAGPAGRTTLLTLGQSIPLASTQKEATWLRAALKDIVCPWFDISAGRDVLGFDGFDPSRGRAACYAAGFERAFGRRYLLPLRWNGYATHFLYFSGRTNADAPWDWFSVLLDPKPLSAHLARAKRKDGAGVRRLPF